jgi:pimeloyl-ACP methyl ester carboxylesterase
MSNQRTHYATTTDGVTIGGTVRGEGPPLVFLHGIIGDGDLDWRALLPHLPGRHTCYLPSLRGRGLSGEHSDLSIGRVTDDFLTYVDSIGEPVGLVGWSGGANFALATAAQSDAVEAVAAIEPIANSRMDEQEQAALGGAVARTAELAEAGMLTDAVRAFADWPFTDEDIVVAEDTGYFKAAARYVPSLLNFFQQFTEHEGPLPDDPAVLGAIQAPVLILHGSDSSPFIATSARHVTAHVPRAHMQEIPGAGHATPLTRPEALARALAEWFSSARQTWRYEHDGSHLTHDAS